MTVERRSMDRYLSQIDVWAVALGCMVGWGAFVIAQLASRVGSLETMGAPSFLLLALWCLVGFVFYWRTAKQTGLTEFDGVTLSSIVLFCLLFYSAIMWFVKTLISASGGTQMTSVVFASAAALIVLVGLGLAVMLYVQSLLRNRFKGLAREKIRAEEGSRAKSQFLFNMSHDIRTPLNAIVGYTHLAQQEPDTPERVRDYVEKIEASSGHLLALVDDILEMGQIENGKVELEIEETDLLAVLREVENLFAPQMAEKGISFTVEVDVDDAWVMCDGNRLVRILQNLISNAYKFTPESGSVSLRVFQVGQAVDGRCLYELRVKDTGIGMSEGFVGKVFEAFERERTSTKSGLQGTGLGMAITKRLVD